MPFSGDTFTKLYDWFTDARRNERIVNTRLENEFAGIATGLSTAAASASSRVLRAGDTMTGTLAITPASGTTKALDTLQIGPNTGVVQASFQYNSIIVSDGANITPAGEVAALYVGHAINSGAAGQHYGIYSAVSHAIATPGVQGDLIGGVFYVQSTASAGGTNTGAGAIGSLYGANPNAYLDATNYEIISAGEADCSVSAGGTVKHRLGWMVASAGPTAGAVTDGAFAVGASTGSWNTALLLHTFHGGSPLSTTASIIASDGVTQTITNGISLPNWTISGKIFEFAKYTLTGDGVADHQITIAANTSGAGISLVNPQVATAGNQRYGPRLRLTGQGWKTDATAASQTVDWVLENLPVQGAANPTAQLLVSSQINNAGYQNSLTLTNDLNSTTAQVAGVNAAQVTLGVASGGGGLRGLFYADNTETIVGSVTALPLVLQSNSADVATLSSTGIVVDAGKLTLKAGTTSLASLNIPQGAAPTSPVDGDVWREDNTDTGLKIRINGATKTVTVS
jgi:hypothetical protein